MEETKTKTCIKCKEEKPLLDNFYKAGRGYQTLCKPCHNKSRMKNYSKRPTGFSKLNEDVKKGILEDIKNGLKFTEIAPKYNINYFNLTNWKRKGLLILE